MRVLPVALLLAAAVLLGLSTAPAASAVPPDDADGEDTGLHLLREAAAAARTREYSGVLSLTARTAGGEVSTLVSVSGATGGGPTAHEVSAAGPGRSERVDPGSPAGGMSAPVAGMLAVLARNYRVVLSGTGTAAGREGQVVRAVRPDGTEAARFWIDGETRLPLRREILDGRGRVTHVAAFVELTVGRAGVRPSPVEGLAPDPETLADLHRRGWVFPNSLSGRMDLFAANDSDGNYLYLGYSDGLSVVSVFVQPGRLDEDHLRGWNARTRPGHTIWIRDSARREAIWASGGLVYTVVADAPSDTFDAAVAALPHAPEPGFWARMGKGASRLASWANPFG